MSEVGEDDRPAGDAGADVVSDPDVVTPETSGADRSGEAPPDDSAEPALDDEAPVASDEARRALEAVLIVAETPVPAQLLAQLLELPVSVVEALLAELAAEYASSARGFEIVAVAGGWRYQSHADLAPYVERFVLEGQTARLSAAALETLAIVAYKQPISRAQIAAIRGVNVDGVIRTLDQRGYIAEVARDPGPGQAVLYGTTPRFLERLGLNSVDDLPPVADFVPGADVVEALEHGLRIDAQDAGAPVEPDAAPAPAPAAGADGADESAPT